MRRDQRKFGALLLLVLLALAANAGCSKKKAPPPRVVPVTAGIAEQKNIPLQIKAIGSAEAHHAVAIKAQVGGEVEQVLFREGQDVQKGDILFVIDQRPLEAALKQAEAALARSSAQAKNAEEQAKRYALLVEKDYVPRDQYDQIRANADALAAAVDADRANVEQSRLQLSYGTIRAPISGRAGSVQVNAGNIIKANDLVMTTINQISPIFVAFSVPEQYLAEIKQYSGRRDLTVEAFVPGLEKPARGELSFIDNAVQTATGTIRLKGLFPNRDKLLWPGQFVDVVLTLTTERNRVVIPSSALQTGQQGQFLYVIREDGTAELRDVMPGRNWRDWTIIEQGVAAGERVVTDGQLRLTPGAKVSVKQ